MEAFRRVMRRVVDCSRSGDTQTPDSVKIDMEPQPKMPKIQKVPKMLREIEANQKCYDPLVVSIGPFHHGNDQLEITEELKRTMARQYANNDDHTLDLLYNKVKAVAGHARDCYSEGSTEAFDVDKFTEMMFLDGCFILQFVHSFVNHKCYENLKMKSSLAAFVRQDLLLLENQLPFQVLMELMSLKFDEVVWKDTFIQFIATLLVPRVQSKSDQNHIDREMLKFDQFAHLLDMFQTMLINKAALNPPDPTKRIFKDWFSYRSAKELKEVGIHFKPSESHKLTDVQFTSQFITIKGLLKLPPIVIDDSTKAMLLNMVAYEACPDAPDDLGVSSYICFMDSLIDHAEDVKELRKKGILLNYLGSDQQVADLFNQIADNLVSNPNIYKDVKDRLERHYKNKIKIWLAEWLHTHFTSPWTVLAFLGAIFALVLSVIQTYEAVYATETPSCPCTVANRTI